MKLLIDTHILVWWLEDDPRLKPRIRVLIADKANDVFVSVASFWELSIKFRKGGIADNGSASWRDAEAEGFEVLALKREHIGAYDELVMIAGHNDPFDHLILAQAIAEGAALITNDAKMRSYGVRCIPA